MTYQVDTRCGANLIAVITSDEVRRSLTGVLRYFGSRDEWHAMLIAQSGRCAICDEPMRRPCVDHDHRCCPQRTKTCGQCTRGLLCARCNSLIAAYDKSEGWQRAAGDYLARFAVGRWWCRAGQHRLEPMPSGACRRCARERQRKYWARKRAKDGSSADDRLQPGSSMRGPLSSRP